MNRLAYVPAWRPLLNVRRKEGHERPAFIAGQLERPYFPIAKRIGTPGGPFPHRGGDRRHVVERRHQHDVGGRVARPNRAQESESVELGHAHVSEHDIRRFPGDRRERGATVSREMHHQPFVAEGIGERFPDG